MALRGRPLYEDRDARISILAAAHEPTCRIRLCRPITSSSNLRLQRGGPYVCARCLLVNRNDGAVDECVFEVWVIAHGVEKTLENARLCPPQKSPELAVPVAELGRQVALGRSRPHPPEYRFQKQTVVLISCSSIAGFPRPVRFKPLPHPICHHKPLLVHSNLHFGSLNQKSLRMGILIVHRP